MNVVARTPAVPEPRPDLVAGARPTAIVPKSLDEAYRLAKAIVMSGTAPKGVSTPEACMIAIMHGLEIGLAPLTALQRISVINGRPTLWGDGAMSLVRGSGLCEYVNERIEGEGEATTAICEVQRRGEPEPIVRTFSVADAKRAGLWGKAGPWQQYPARMLAMRARGFALRDGFADVLGGMYLREEIDEDERPTKPRDAITSGIGNKPGQLPPAKLAQPRPPQPAPSPPPQPIPPQPEDDWPPPLNGDEDHGPDADEPEDPLDIGAQPEVADERTRLLEAAHEKAKQGSRKLRWWRARLTPEQEALIGDWSGLDELAKAADG
jgi:hypothetical protein